MFGLPIFRLGTKANTPTVSWNIVSGLPAGDRLAIADNGSTDNLIPSNGNVYEVPITYRYDNGQTLATDVAFVTQNDTPSTVRMISLSSANQLMHCRAAELGIFNGTTPWISLSATHPDLGANQGFRDIINTINVEGTTHNIRFFPATAAFLRGTNNNIARDNVAGLTITSNDTASNNNCFVYLFSTPALVPGGATINVSVWIMRANNNTLQRVISLTFNQTHVGGSFAIQTLDNGGFWVFPNGIRNGAHMVFI